MLSDPVLLEKVDKLCDLNIGQHVPLPQLVVVGDQSSGKSSLLESLTGIPFPKDQSLCTRHATQIACRHVDDDRVDIRIIPGSHASDEHRKYVEAFHCHAKSGLEFREQFVDILKKANARMGLRIDVLDGNGPVFSEDILKIDVQGPHEDNLTIIDIPGIFRTTTQGTTKEDMVMVKDLVKSYIKDARTIILAVLPSNVDIATQEILELAEDYDKNGDRTLGVLTKPDLVLEPSAQAAVCDLVCGKRRPLTLGYFLVRNRGAKAGSQIPMEQDPALKVQPWIDLPRDRVGIPALKAQLSLLLIEITKREFPKVIQDVNNQIRQCKKDLQELGPPRQDEREQRSFLSHMAGTFQDRTRAALAADYNSDPIFHLEPNLRLITRVVNITDIFSSDFQESGHARHFEKLDVRETDMAFETPSESDYEETPAGLMIEQLRALLEEAKVDDIAPGELVELSDIIVTERVKAPPREAFTKWITSVYLQSRGLDLSTVNANLVSMAFAEQSSRWGDITKVYMSRVIITIHRFIAAALRSACPEELARSQLWSAILDTLLERYKAAMEQAKLLIEVERRKQPYTLNGQYSINFSKAQGHRLRELLRPKARKDTIQYGELQYMVNLDDIARAAECKRNVDQLQEVIHDILHAYYGIAADRFIDNIFQLAVDYSLLHGPSSPLKVFTQEWVINLEPELLDRIVGEPKSARKRRLGLVRKIEDLSKALKILKT